MSRNQEIKRAGDVYSDAFEDRPLARAWFTAGALWADKSNKKRIANLRGIIKSLTELATPSKNCTGKDWAMVILEERMEFAHKALADDERHNETSETE